MADICREDDGVLQIPTRTPHEIWGSASLIIAYMESDIRISVEKRTACLGFLAILLQRFHRGSRRHLPVVPRMLVWFILPTRWFELTS
jgi:hypothetical protein